MIAALPAAISLTQALMGPDAPAVADPRAATAGADFAMMMAGLGAPAPPAVASDAADTDATGDGAAPRGRDADDDGDQGSEDAALLAMLALTPPPASRDQPAPDLAADTQPPATVSPDARSMAQRVPIPLPVDGAAAAVDAATGGPPVASPLPATAAAVRKLELPLATGDAARTATQPPAAVIAAIGEADTAAAPDHKRGAAAASDDPAPAPIPGLVPADAASVAAPAPSADRALAVQAASSPAPADLAAQLGEQRLSLAQGSGWLDQLARDIAATAGIEGKLHFRLNPEHLGSLHVEVTRGAEGAAVRLTTDTRAARDILVDAQPQLVAEARAQGVRIAGTHVDLGGTGGGQSASGEGRRAAQGFVPQVRAIGGGPAATDTTEPRGAAPERYA